MIEAMLWILGAWFVALMAGVPLFAAIGIAADVFVPYAGINPTIVP